jgi:hypothetical protein
MASETDTRPLVIRVEDILTRQSWVYLFTATPVWVGCGAEASLLLARPKISAQHGCFHFDHHAVRYQDLDPGVGTLIDGMPAGGHETTLTEWSQVEMGDLRLTVSRRPPEEPILDPRQSPFAGTPAGPVGPPPRLWGLPQPQPPPATLVLPEGPPPATPPPAEEPPPLSKAAPRRKAKAGQRPRRRRRAWGRAILMWLSALGVGVVIVGFAGLLLQYRGLAWMPPWLKEQIPPWVETLFR